MRLETAAGDLGFPEFGRRTCRRPAGGAAVFNCNLLHEATPVTHGERIVAARLSAIVR